MSAARRGRVVVVFARAPRLGTVKRRLARGIGDRGALRFYRAQLDAVARRLAADRRWTTLLAVTPDRARARWPAVPRVDQGRGDLGDRLHRAARGRRLVVVVGSDVPGLAPADVAAAFRALGRAGAVFGPAEDGGYWLVGLGPRRPARPFAAVRWSTEHALGDTLANFRGRPVAFLRPLRDVDTAADLAAVRAAPPGSAPARAAPPAVTNPAAGRRRRDRG